MIDDWGDAFEAGAAVAFGGLLLDQHAEKLREEMRRTNDVNVHVHTEKEDTGVLIDASEHSDFTMTWDDYVGQDRMKQQLKIHVASARKREAALEHVLLAAGKPGVGKTTMARLIAKEMGVRIIMLVPPFHANTMFEAAQKLKTHEILFIDEIHKLADHGPKAAENLLHLLEEKKLYLDSGVRYLADITVIGATTDADKLPETVIDRFPIKPYFEEYSFYDMCAITARFEGLNKVELPYELTCAIAKASRTTPRVARELVVGARDIYTAIGKYPTIEELLDFKDLEPDGMTRKHKDYITGLYRYFSRVTADGRVEYIAGEASMAQMLREPRNGIQRIERFLIERGLIDRTPRGRRLTQRGIQRAREWLNEPTGIQTPTRTRQAIAAPVAEWLFQR